MAWKRNTWSEAIARRPEKVAGPVAESRRGRVAAGLSVAGVLVLGVGFAWILLSRSPETDTSERARRLPPKPSASPHATQDHTPRPEARSGDVPKIDVPTFDVREQPIAENRTTNATPIARRQLRGTQARIERALARGQRRLFAHDSECYLSNFAIPGEQVPPIPYDKDLIADLMKALDEPVEVEMGIDTEEDVQLKNIVQGMKEELRDYLGNGGTAEGYLAELQKRQDREADCYAEALQMVNRASKGDDPAMAYELWRRTNRHLEEQGIRTLPLPRRLRKFAETREP